MSHSKKLEETALWRAYMRELEPDSARAVWVKEVYEAAVNYLSDVRQDFRNYTLHDGTHILNVLDAMGGVLGDQVLNLTTGEAELLVLAASLHDLGMVYTEDEKVRHYGDAEECRKFLRTYCPELLGCPAEKWPEDTRQWYLRTLHPFRIPEVLQNAGWKELFSRCPMEVVPKGAVLAVCMAHGENAEALPHIRELTYLSANDADPLFCALLLRLGDLLDFDGTRAPRVLYGYVAYNSRSRAEWDKHQASAGFRYPASPSTDQLPYKARCTSPGVEHAVRDFLGWIDDELASCIKLQTYCRAAWQRFFPFPRAVSREEIESDGYMGGDFSLTMDQAQILNLLVGENLYGSRNVFVRELLQNAIDATLLREKMEDGFIPEQSRIDVWEWYDKEGNIWFRIDDQGTGMTLGMLQRYFLKVGNSYYTSREMELDLNLRGHDPSKRYQGISRFGIGFLSCFLCGDYAEVSTLYFDPAKNRREESAAESYQTVYYGLRLQVTGLDGYYTLKSQAMHHPSGGPMPCAPGADPEYIYGREGYRAQAGTSIAVRLDPGKLGAMDLGYVVEKYLCGARVPVYYNNKRIGRTYGEVMEAAHKLAGERLYELPEREKVQFDRSFPAACGNYPRVVMTVSPLDSGEDHVLQGVSGVLAKYDVRFDRPPEWEADGYRYEVRGHIRTVKNGLQMDLESCCKERREHFIDRKDLEKKFGREATEALMVELDRHSECPRTAEQLGGVWHPFAGQIEICEAWGAYRDAQQKAEIYIQVEECGCPNMALLTANPKCVILISAFQGVVAGQLIERSASMDYPFEGVFFLENQWRPETDVSRSKITKLPFPFLVMMNAVLNKYHMLHWLMKKIDYMEGWRKTSLREWRAMRTAQFKQWMEINQRDYFADRKKCLAEPWAFNGKHPMDYEYLFCRSDNAVLNDYQDACFQDCYEMTINYEEGQVISFREKERGGSESVYDLFPPMLFCKAATDRSRRYVCDAHWIHRKGITADHPFVAWLINNADLLTRFYQRQFWQMVETLYEDMEPETIIWRCNWIRQQLISFPEHHGIDVNHFPELSMDDFWTGEDKTEAKERMYGRC